MTLISFTSKQIWPQVLAVAHLKPDRMHNHDLDEEKTQTHSPVPHNR